MPIKPENRVLYPADWPQIRLRVLERAQYSCEHPGCQARQYAVGKWLNCTIGGWLFIEWERPASYSEARQRAAELYHAQGEEGPKPIVIVLTVAHLNHDPTDCADENLRLLCQRHHLAHDHHHHMANAQATRRAKGGTLELF